MGSTIPAESHQPESPEMRTSAARMYRSGSRSAISMFATRRRTRIVPSVRVTTERLRKRAIAKIAEAMALERLIRTRGAVMADPGATGAAAREADGRSTDTHGADARGGRLLLALPLGELVRLGLVSNRGMVVVAGAFALAWQAVPDRLLADLVRDYAGQAVGYAGSVVQGLAARLLALVLFYLGAVVSAFASSTRASKGA